MTAVVGWLCKDGVVIGSDSAITFSTGTQFTIEQTGDKIFIIGEKVIIAGSGGVGFQQRFCSVVQSAYDKKLFTKNHIDVGRTLSSDLNNDLASTRADRGQYCALIAYASGDDFYLCEFTIRDFQPEWKDINVKFASIGCGQNITDPFLAFMKKVFLGEKEQPTVALAKFITYWTLSHVCELNPGGIKEPIQMAQLMKNEKGYFMANKLGEAELDEHDAITKEAIGYLGKFKDEITGKTAKKIPSIESNSKP